MGTFREGNRRSGAAAARDDWEQRRARHMTTRTFQRTQPALLQGTLFYYSSVGSVPWGPEFCEEYNTEISRLIEAHGVPAWAPGSRSLSVEECRAALVEHKVGDLRDLSAEQQRFVSQIAKLKGADISTSGMAHVPVAQLFILNKIDNTHNCREIIVIDLLEMRYMSSYILDL